jgi:pimeloyl-ACP methyl ester carboxylesterase
LISTRQAPRAGRIAAAPRDISYHLLLPNRTWREADRGTFVAAVDPAVPTTIFIHGNRTGRVGALCDAWRVYRRMQKDAAGRPFRLVVWSWPSDRIAGRQRYDVQVKDCYSDAESYYLADLLAEIGDRQPRARIALVGYSFGAKIILGALHLVAGGRVAGRGLPDRTPSRGAVVADGKGAGGEKAAGRPVRTPFRAVLIASAVSAGSLLPGQRDGLAATQVDAILITRNACDPALRWYPRLYGRRGPQAMGYVGVYTAPQFRDKIEQIDVTGSVGRQHDWSGYVSAPALVKRLARYTFLDEPGRL